MSTNARIGVELLPGELVESIYTHWDGYPSHHGQLLLDHWDTRARVRDLIALGDLSVLGEEVGQQHDFNAPYDDPVSRTWCLAYGRDRGEQDKGPVRHGADEWPDYGQQYEYLFTTSGWQWREAIYTRKADDSFLRTWSEWQPLTPEVCADDADPIPMLPGGALV